MNGPSDCWKRWACLVAFAGPVCRVFVITRLIIQQRPRHHFNRYTSVGEGEEAGEGEGALTRLLNALGGLRLVLLAATHLFIY